MMGGSVQMSLAVQVTNIALCKSLEPYLRKKHAYPRIPCNPFRDLNFFSDETGMALAFFYREVYSKGT